VAFALLRTGRDEPIIGVERIELNHSAAPSVASLPPLPEPLASAQGAVQQTKLFVAGVGTDGTAHLFSIDFIAPQPAWIAHAGWPGAAEKITGVAARDAALFVTLAPSSGTRGDRLLRWSDAEGWKEKAPAPGGVVVGTMRAIGQAHLLCLVRVAPPTGSGPAACRLFSYHTITGSWAALGEPLPGNVRVGTAWRDGMLALRDAREGAADFVFTEIVATKRLLRPLDWAVLVLYLGIVASIGFYFYAREKKQSATGFFMGDRKIPFWAAALSLYATGTSSISFIAIPAKSFATDWRYLANNLIGILGLMFVAVWIVPLIRRLDVMSVYHYLELRFHRAIRMLASILCIVVQLGGRMSVVLYLPSLAISTVTGIDIVWSILGMGVTTIVYTVMGGMKAVIWTDVVQCLMKFGGIFFTIGFIFLKLDGGVGEFWEISMAERKLRTFDFSFDFTQATVWGFLIYVVLDTILTYPKDQVMMQRVLATKSGKEAGRSVWMLALIMVPASCTFYLIGTALYAFYKTHPAHLNPLLTVDATFPMFVAAELPAGFTGLIIAAIFASAMATISSIINSVATLVSVDFYEQIAKTPNQKTSVRLAEIMTVVAGVIGVGTALILTRYDIRSLFDLSIELAGLLGGGFAGTYALGMFTRRANWQGAMIGVGTALVVTFTAWSLRLVHPFFYAGIAILTCIVVGYLASLLFPAPAQSLEGLTIYDPKTKVSEPVELVKA
jgi:SSS family transporter